MLEDDWTPHSCVGTRPSMGNTEVCEQITILCFYSVLLYWVAILLDQLRLEN
jgi:hypothetical protein